ncbi:MAG: TetR/AcrR family transcriptional regulator C-terminal domain-containing protein [Oscillospiraceae bacterium]
MSKSLITKKALGEAMKQLMSEQPFEKISVRDICAACGMNRNSFYYHFRDKQDLVFWIFDYEFIQKVKSRSYAEPFELFQTIAEYFSENRAYYIHAFAFTGQNCFSDYFSEVFTQLCFAQIDKYFGEDPNAALYARFTADTLRMSLVRWLNDGDAVSPQLLTQITKRAFIALSERGAQLYPDEIADCRKRREQRDRENHE